MAINQGQHQQDKQQRQQEQAAPVGGRNDKAGQGRADGRGDGEGHGYQPHVGAAPLRRVEGEDGVHQQGHGDGRRQGLEEAAEQQHAEIRGQQTDERAEGKVAEGEQGHGAGRKPLNQAGGNRRKGAHDQQEAGGQPLGLGFVEVECGHKGGQGHIEQGVIEIAEEAPDEEGADNQQRRETGVVGQIAGRVGVG